EFGVQHSLNLSDIAGLCAYTYLPRLDDEVDGVWCGASGASGASGVCVASEHVCAHNSAYQVLRPYGNAGAEGALGGDNARPPERVRDASHALVAAGNCHHVPVGGDGDPPEAVIVLDVDPALWSMFVADESREPLGRINIHVHRASPVC